MKKKVVALLMALTLVLMAFPLAPAHAAGEMTFKDFSLSVWPEYDDPRVLVIYQGTMVNTSGADLPNGTDVFFNIPKGAEIGMACEIVDGGGHSCQPYKTVDKGDYVQLSWKTTKPIKANQEYPIFLEFYYNPIKGTTDKTIDYKFIPSYTIQQLNLAVKQPLKATNFKIDPVAAATSQDAEGFTDHNYTWNNLTVNDKDKVTLKISYTKTDPKPSKEKPQPGQQQAGGQNEGSGIGTSAWTQPTVIVPVILFVVILVVFIVYALNNSNRRNTERIHRIKSQARSKGESRGAAVDPKVAKEKKRIRQMLLNGEISEETYHELLMEIEEEHK